MRLDVFADIFVARDGDATTAGLEILAAGVVILMLTVAVIGVVCWIRRRQRHEEWTAWRQHRDASEQQLEGTVTSLCDRIVRDYGMQPEKPERHLKAVKGA